MKRLILAFAILGLSGELLAQCNSSSGSNQGSITPTTSYQTQSSADGGEYWTFTADPCNSYTFTFCSNGGSASFDTQLTITDGSGTPMASGYNDDNCGLQSEITWTPTSSGTYRIFVTEYDCSNTGTGGTFAYRSASSATISGDFNLMSDATSSSSDCGTLTTASNDQLGAVWDNNSVLDFTGNFSYDYTINLGSSDGGADGIAFVIQNDGDGLCATGTSGGSMGAGGISNSIIVEVDTYLNTEDRDDGITSVVCSGGPDPDHLDLWTNGSVNPSGTCGSSPGARVIAAAERLEDGGANYNIENGSDHVLRIAWTAGSPGTLVATVMNSATTTTYASVSYSFTATTVFGTNTPYFGFTGSTGGLSNEQSFCFPGTLLPVDLLHFKAVALEDMVTVRWKTGTELNNDHFIVERSIDGLNFKPIGRVGGNGTTGEAQLYQFNDESPIEGGNYYRLKQVDFNGKNNYSPIDYVAFDKQGDLSVGKLYPQPASSYVNLELKSRRKETIQVLLYNMVGQQITSLETAVKPGMNELVFDTEGLSGVYQLVIKSSSGVFSKKLLVKR